MTDTPSPAPAPKKVAPKKRWFNPKFRKPGSNRRKPNLPKPSDEMASLEKRLGVKFKNKTLLSQALTHPSHAPQTGMDNARLEFLGDSVLGLAISDILYHGSPKSDEGDMTKSKSHLVSTKFFSDLALKLSLDKFIKVGSGEKRFGTLTPSMLAALFESVIGAMYLDQGFQKTFKFIEGLYEPLLKGPAPVEDLNHKGALQEILQRKYKEQPRYEMIRESGPGHAKTFEVQVSFRGKIFGIGKGNSKKDAEMEAAREALTVLGKE